MQDFFKRAVFADMIFRTMTSHPDAIQASGLSSELNEITKKLTDVKKLRGSLKTTQIVTAGLLGLIAGAALMGRKKETKYLFGGNPNDF